MNLETFAQSFAEYVDESKKARQRDQAERQLSSLFIGFVAKCFNVQVHDIVLEQHVFLADVNRQGYIDALLGNLVIEFKRQITSNKNQWLDQLKSYLLTRSENHIGLLTDGLEFEAYVLEDGKLVQTDKFNLATLDAQSAFSRLDAYLFSQTNIPPTAVDVEGRFGASSPSFRTTFIKLQSLLAQVNDSPMLTVWREQWRRLLSKVYGSDIGSDDLFIRHTYLCQFARLLAYAALRGLPDSNDTVEEIVNGSAFEGEGVNNIAELDFFSWILMDEIKDEALTLLRQLAAGLIVYDLKRIDQDLLKQLYQNLVDPVTRHDLGEYYTPDWLAELTLEDIQYREGQSLLDPACGSGSFLFNAIKRLSSNGLTGWKLVEFAVDNIVGMDVHPLAVTVARVNYLLALAEHMRSSRTGSSGLLTLPVYMADALIRPLENRSHDALTVPVDERLTELFHIPVEAASKPSALTEVIDKMYEFAKRAGSPDHFRTLVQTQFGASISPASVQHWVDNLKLLTKLIKENRNGIWSYILKNVSSPLVLAERQFDVIAGNPPWLSYRFIKNADYQKQVKSLYQHYKLIESDDVKLFTHMDLSTLFFALARDRYLKSGGTIAFVLPRAVMTGAKQHRPFQAQGVTRIIDLLGTFPLFNVPTCVLIREGDVIADRQAVPAVRYTGTLTRHEMPLDEAQAMLNKRPSQVRFVDSDIRSPHYYDLFVQGATLVPRNLCFVKPQNLPSSPAVETDPDADVEAKKPWKGVKLRGAVQDDYLYTTLLSKFLMPFGYQKMHMVALPCRLNDDKSLSMMSQDVDYTTKGHFDSLDWFKSAEAKWDELKKDSSAMSFQDRLNYHNTLSLQQPKIGFKVLYTSSGVHISSCIVSSEQNFEVHKRLTQGFIVDYKTYFYTTASEEEAHYLCALLNSTWVDNAIKDYQSRGKGEVGQRDISRTPFEACAIPPFDPSNADHCELARLSQEAHTAVEMHKTSGSLKGGVVSIRRAARAAAAAQITAIDAIAQRIVEI